MKSNQTFGLHYVLRLNKEKKGRYPIYARIVVNKTRVELSTKQYIPKSDWDEARDKAKPRTDELRLLNSYLEELRAKIATHYRELKLSDEEVTAETVKAAYLGISKESLNDGGRTLLWLVKQHNTVMKEVLRWGTLKNYHTTERYLREFLKTQTRSGDIPLRRLTYSFLTGFEYFVRTVPLKNYDRCTNNGTMKHIERLKKMSAWAAKNEWIAKDPFVNYQLKFQYKVREFLTELELQDLEGRHFDDPVLQKVKDLFVFSCYTGLSYADVMALEPRNIVAETDGFSWIQICRVKTNTPVDVPLLDVARRILEKFKRESAVEERDTIFPYVPNQVVNRSLKIISEICGFSKRMTFHLARHTFATTVTLCNGVPIESISKMLGHTKITTTMIYAKVVKTKISEDMVALREKLAKEKKQKQLYIAV